MAFSPKSRQQSHAHQPNRRNQSHPDADPRGSAPGGVGRGRRGGVAVVGGAALGSAGGGGGRGRLVGGEEARHEHLVDLVDGEGGVLAEGVVDGGFDSAGGDVDLVVLAGDVEAEDAALLTEGEGADGVADGEEVGEGVVFGADVVLDHLHLLLGAQVVQGPRGKVLEGVVRRGEQRHPVVGVVHLAVQLLARLGHVQELDEPAVSPGFLQDCGDVDGARGGRGRGRLGVGGGRQEGEEEEEDGEEGGARWSRHCVGCGKW